MCHAGRRIPCECSGICDLDSKGQAFTHANHADPAFNAAAKQARTPTRKTRITDMQRLADFIHFELVVLIVNGAMMLTSKG